MSYLSRPRRPRRAAEWSNAKAVTFIVTLAARRSVTLAAARAGMSRKSAYALRGRDPAFAAAWDAAWKAGAARRRPTPGQGDKGDEGDDPRFRRPQGNSVTLPDDARWFFETLANWRGESAPPRLAHRVTLP